MTFEEWWGNEYTTTNLSPGEKQHLIISKPNQRKVWNAAIDAAALKVRQQMNFGALYPEDALSDLKAT